MPNIMFSGASDYPSLTERDEIISKGGRYQPIVPVPQQQPQVVDDGGGGEAHQDAGVVGRVVDGVARVAALHVVRVRVAVQQRRAHVARQHARAAHARRHVLFRHCNNILFILILLNLARTADSERAP